MYVIECMQDAGKEDYLRPSERIGLDWIVQLLVGHEHTVEHVDTTGRLADNLGESGPF